jgi:hypothetical protein
MRKISEDSAKALLNGKTFKRDNTKVEVSENKKYSFLYLFGIWIARKNLLNGDVCIRTAKHPTMTTKDRLNAIIYCLYTSVGVHIPYRKIFHKYGELYIASNDSYNALMNKTTPITEWIKWNGDWFALIGDDDNLPIEDNSSQLKTVSMVSAMFNIMCADDTKTSNKYQKRFLNTVDGINFPDGWENLSEVEKSKRLNKAVKVNL